MEEGRGESLAAWVCALLLGDTGVGSGNKHPRTPRPGVGALGKVFFHGKGSGEAGVLQVLAGLAGRMVVLKSCL